MKNFIFLLFFISSTVIAQNCDSLILQTITNPGPYTVSNIDESDGLRDGPNYSGATIYYPDNNNNLSSIIFVPGYSNTQLTIQNWGPYLAAHGIVTMTIGTNSLLDSHIQRRDALLDALITLKEENSRINSPLYNRLDTNRLALGGFSKGGGGAQLAASINNEIDAVIALYPWLENITATDLNHSTPVMIVSGELDAIAPPFLHADVHYNYTPNTTNKLKFEVALAGHDPLSGPYAGLGDVGFKTLSWLKTYMLEDSCYCPYLLDNPISASSYITNIICPDLTTVIIDKNINNRKIINIVDILGRKIDIKESKVLYYIYNDGYVEKKIITN
tara:strand:+ start:84 stop:1076 length:993 start_codon:yes stop_codon:yes gene_type:complete